MQHLSQASLPNADPLRNLCKELRSPVNLDADRLNRIRTYYSTTGLKTDLVYRLAEVSLYLTNHSNPTLNRNCKQLKADFTQYIEKRIQDLSQPCSCAQKEVDRCENQELRTAEWHVRDVLFATEEIVKLNIDNIDEVKVKQIKEVFNLLTHTLPQYKQRLSPEKQTVIKPLELKLHELLDKLGGAPVLS